MLFSCFGLSRCRASPWCTIRNPRLRTCPTRLILIYGTEKNWEDAPDLRAFVDWVTKSDDEDFLLRPDAGSIDDREGLRERVSR